MPVAAVASLWQSDRRTEAMPRSVCLSGSPHRLSSITDQPSRRIAQYGACLKFSHMTKSRQYIAENKTESTGLNLDPGPRILLRVSAVFCSGLHPSRSNSEWNEFLTTLRFAFGMRDKSLATARGDSDGVKTLEPAFHR
ncbi:hypothetical protein RRG08_057205 [Elysia crispata]|uniref:Uncharacterized protein n=1 Tax=Elysia crispata TaxID=231223 RepID=A0AAE0XXX9_9GAST|nr:hypothetical protein RRG08_057205 [Elysia crispata]